jgi:SAM-dependent methyltransferase
MNVPYSIADRLFVGPERENVQLSRALTEIPYLTGRRGGSHSLSDWAYSIGVFHTVLRYTLGERDKIDLLDVGCGTGRLALASKLLLGQDGRYVGVDVNAAEIEQCQRQYSDSRFKFIHLPHKNRVYASDQAPTFEPYPLDDNSFDVVTALSVWTHLNEADATFYFRPSSRFSFWTSDITRFARPALRAKARSRSGDPIATTSIGRSMALTRGSIRPGPRSPRKPSV